MQANVQPALNDTKQLYNVYIYITCSKHPYEDWQAFYLTQATQTIKAGLCWINSTLGTHHTGESLIESSEWTLFGDWEKPFEQKTNGSFHRNGRNNKSANHHLDCDHTTFDNIVFVIEFPKNLYQY